MDAVDKRSVIKYFLLKGFSPTEVHNEMSRTLGKDAPTKRTIYRWSNNFRFGRMTVKNEKPSGRPKTVTDEEAVEDVRSMVMKDRRLTVKFIGETLKISPSRVWSIITNDLCMKKVAARWVPKLLTEEQKKERVRLSRQNLRVYNANEEDFLARFVTMVETWVHYFDPETRQQSMEWKHPGSPTPKKARRSTSAGKVMASVFWDSEGILMIDYLEKGETLTSEYYSSLLVKLREEIRRKRRGKLAKGVLFHQDNAPIHKAARSMATIRENGFEIIEHPPYSPDLAPSDYFLFGNLKNYLRGTSYGSDNDVFEAVEGYFRSQNASFYLKGIKDIRKRWERCIVLKGEYVEK